MQRNDEINLDLLESVRSKTSKADIKKTKENIEHLVKDSGDFLAGSNGGKQMIAFK